MIIFTYIALYTSLTVFWTLHLFGFKILIIFDLLHWHLRPALTLAFSQQWLWEPFRSVSYWDFGDVLTLKYHLDVIIWIFRGIASQGIYFASSFYFDGSKCALTYRHCGNSHCPSLLNEIMDHFYDLGVWIDDRFDQIYSNYNFSEVSSIIT